MMPDNLFKNPGLVSAAGKAHICIPLTEVYAHPKMRWPISMRVTLMRRGDGRRSDSVQSSRPLAFRANDVPSGALERQAAAPPPEFHEALMQASGYFRSRAVLYRLCIEKHPDIQPALTGTYRAWEARHRPDINFIDQVRFDTYREQMSGRTEIAARADDDMTDATRKALEQVPATQLRQRCEAMLEDLAESEDLTQDAIGDELEIVRKYAPRQATGGVK